jgi:glutamine synthetase
MDMKSRMDELETHIKQAQMMKDDYLASATYWKENVLVSMNKLREVVDTLETKVDEKSWPMPTYIDLLFGIK